MENEVWKDVVGYEGLYQVSNLGRLKSLEKSTKFYSGYQKKICERKYPERIICKNHISNGYLQIELFKNGKVKKLTMHRIVAKSSFIFSTTTRTNTTTFFTFIYAFIKIHYTIPFFYKISL